MSLYVAQAQPLWQDLNGGQVTQFITLKDQTAATLGDFADVMAASRAISDMKSIGCYVARYVATTGSSASSGPYNTCRDRAQFIFRCANGQLMRVNVPGPKSSIFLSDNETVDVTNVLVQAFLAAVILACASTAGSAIVALHSAKRVRIRTGTIPE